MFFEHAHGTLQEMAERLKAEQQGRGEVGRNDPCPCGSGLKYKDCCLR